MVTIITACGVEGLKATNTIDFGLILSPYYESELINDKCDDWQDVTISVLEQLDTTLSFRYSSCSLVAEGEIVEFQYKPQYIFSTDYVFGKYKYPTPKATFKLNPNASKHSYLSAPILGITELGTMTTREFLKSRKGLHKYDWEICKIKKIGEHIWVLENPSYKEVPDATYLIHNYANFNEYKLNHDADEAAYKNKYGEQRKKNRACANEQHYWYVAKGGILITIPNPDNLRGGINPTSIIYTSKN